jgi:beta-mannanase
MVSWGSRNPCKGANQPDFQDYKIARGDFDTNYIIPWAKAAAQWGKPMFLRFDHEMNGTWFSWSPGVNGNSVSDWINAWKHVHDVFVAEGATNVKWVWSPYVNCSGCSSLKSVYPGDAYVDWTALDGYNWGTSQSWSTWQTATQIFQSSYNAILVGTRKKAAIAPNKPYMIAETASAEAGGSKANWITDLYNAAIPNNMPLTRAVVWFSADKTSQGETNWRVDSSNESLAAYKAIAAQAAWQGYVP